MKSKKILSVLVAATLVAGTMVGCGKDTTTNETSTKASGKKMDTSPITFTLFNADLSEDMDFNDEIAKEITKRTGVTLKFSYPVGGDTQAVPLMIASGDYTDLIYAKDNTGKLVDAGALVELTDYIDKYGDNLKKLYGKQINRLEYSKDDKSIYTVGTYGAKPAEWQNAGEFCIRNDVLKEQGYPQVKTLDDYEKVIKEYVKKHPTTNGKKTIGVTTMASDWRWLCTIGDPGSQALGLNGDGQWKVDEKTKTATYKFLLPEMKTYFQWLNKMNDEGLLDSEAFIQKQDAYLAKLTSAQAVGIIDNEWNYSQSKTTLIGAGKQDKTFAKFPVVLDSNTTDAMNKDSGFAGSFGIGITTKCKDPKRAFQFLDWMASDEAQILINWGIKGKYYTEENGVRKFLPDIQKQRNTDKDFSKKTGIGRYFYPFPERGDGEKDANGYYYTPSSKEMLAENYCDAEKETLKAYGAKIWCDMGTPRSELEPSHHGQAWQYTIPSDSDLAIIQKKADDYTQKACTNAILGKPADFDKAWDTIQQKLKDMNIEKANEEMSKLVAEKLEMWK